jgi:FMN phosphatase YigB (HAD superfamily)
MGKIKTVIFDIGNVLTDFCWEQFIMNKGYSQEMMERISRASIHTKEWNELDRGIMKEEDVVELFIKKILK